MEMTLRMTRAQVRATTVRYAVTLKPVALDGFVVDTFTRSGDLTSPGEVGAVWTSFNGFDLTAYSAMNGAALYNPQVSSALLQAMASGQPPAGSPYAIEIAFTLDAAAIGGPLSSVSAYGGLNGTDNAVYTAFYYNPNDGYIYMDAADGTNYVDNDVGNSGGPLTAGLHTLRWEVEPGVMARGYLDDALVGALDLSTITDSPDPPFVGLDLRDDKSGVTGFLGGGTNLIQVESFRAYLL